MATEGIAEQPFFIYDHTVLQREEDDIKDAILYYYPPMTSIDDRCALCGQLMGMVRLFVSLTGAPPSIYRLQHSKVAVRHHGRFTVALGGDKQLPDRVLLSQLDFLHELFRFYHQDMDDVAKLCEKQGRDFVEYLGIIWDTYIPFTRYYGDDFLSAMRPVPTLQLTKGQSTLFLRATHLLEACQRAPGVLAGCLLARNRVLCTQLTPTFTSRLLLLRPYQSHLPCRAINTDFTLPHGVRLLAVYITEEEERALYPAWCVLEPEQQRLQSDLQPQPHSQSQEQIQVESQSQSGMADSTRTNLTSQDLKVDPAEEEEAKDEDDKFVSSGSFVSIDDDKSQCSSPDLILSECVRAVDVVNPAKELVTEAPFVKSLETKEVNISSKRVVERECVGAVGEEIHLETNSKEAVLETSKGETGFRAEEELIKRTETEEKLTRRVHEHFLLDQRLSVQIPEIVETVLRTKNEESVTGNLVLPTADNDRTIVESVDTLKEKDYKEQASDQGASNLLSGGCTLCVPDGVEVERAISVPDVEVEITLIRNKDVKSDILIAEPVLEAALVGITEKSKCISIAADNQEQFISMMSDNIIKDVVDSITHSGQTDCLQRLQGDFRLGIVTIETFAEEIAHSILDSVIYSKFRKERELKTWKDEENAARCRLDQRSENELTTVETLANRIVQSIMNSVQHEVRGGNIIMESSTKFSESEQVKTCREFLGQQIEDGSPELLSAGTSVTEHTGNLCANLCTDMLGNITISTTVGAHQLMCGGQPTKLFRTGSVTQLKCEENLNCEFNLSTQMSKDLKDQKTLDLHNLQIEQDISHSTIVQLEKALPQLESSSVSLQTTPKNCDRLLLSHEVKVPEQDTSADSSAIILTKSQNISEDDRYFTNQISGAHTSSSTADQPAAAVMKPQLRSLTTLTKDTVLLIPLQPTTKTDLFKAVKQASKIAAENYESMTSEENSPEDSPYQGMSRTSSRAESDSGAYGLASPAAPSPLDSPLKRALYLTKPLVTSKEADAQCTKCSELFNSSNQNHIYTGSPGREKRPSETSNNNKGCSYQPAQVNQKAAQTKKVICRKRINRGKTGLQEVDLFIQGNADMLLLMMMEGGASQNKETVNKLWQWALPQLEKMDLYIKQRHIMGSLAKKDMEYNYLLYNRSQQTLTGNMTQPVTVNEHKFCDTAIQMHDDFCSSETLTDIMLRSHNSYVYAHSGASQETYFQLHGAARNIPGFPNERQANMAADAVAFQKMLTEEQSLII